MPMATRNRSATGARVNRSAVEDFLDRSSDLPNLAALAREVGISPQYLSDILAGRRPGNGNLFDRMALALGCRTRSILLNPEAALS